MMMMTTIWRRAAAPVPTMQAYCTTGTAVDAV